MAILSKVPDEDHLSIEMSQVKQVKRGRVKFLLMQRSGIRPYVQEEKYWPRKYYTGLRTFSRWFCNI